MKYNIKQFLITIMCLLALFYCCYFINLQNSTNTISLSSVLDEEVQQTVLEPKELFLETWSLIKTNY